MKIGDFAPDFELESNTGEKVRLSSYFGKKKIILFFYVKDNTPGCTAEANGIKSYYPKISEKYEVIGINQDSIESHVNFCQKYDLPFKILSDTSKKVAAQYQARGILGTYTKRITYLIGLDGRIEDMIEVMSVSNHIEFVQSLADS
ncbi:peroxiredoxin [Candidatus Nitrosotalea okcheonensis]|uniref:thioredoxin-dependent peroxiredoxin n=1 Tax=Candidatus Nitrosotalea okcheonensis TaxID=1903276 RepID=A0A2H1FC88_9ARCH|nr:peroxiredoxin [Candidatus Nitrosotalea okcheonensis]SMH70259.1 Peroxiredoxin [Candidatus Nitrosotalea okcheonensis]